MKIIVLNGSPKGDNSVTMTYVKYLQKKYPQHLLEVKHIAQRINKYEKDQAAWKALSEEINSCDGLLWAFPVYFLLIPSNYKRFIELLFERGMADILAGKYSASLSTSIHFYDHTAHNYIRGICDDLGMKFVNSFSAQMNDLMDKEMQKNLCLFFEELIDAVENKAVTARTYLKYSGPNLDYRPGAIDTKVELEGSRIILVAESIDAGNNLGQMVARFQESLAGEIRVIDLSKANIAGPCLGCIHCGSDNECAYDGKDDVRPIYEQLMKEADIIVFAASIRDRYFSARWKNFIDRRFFMNHVPAFHGKQIGFLISGHLAYDANLRQILEAMAEMDQANLVDIITDEYETSQQLDERISYFAGRLVKSFRQNYHRPGTFLRVGGRKIFRDDIWGWMRFVFLADYKYYKKHGLINFPQKEVKTRLSHLIIPFLKIKPVKRFMQKNVTVLMHHAHDRVVQRLPKE